MKKKPKTVLVNGMKFRTGYDAEAPPRKKNPWRDLVLNMVPGQWVDFPNSTYSYRMSLYRAATFLGVKIITKKNEGGGFRCWRV